MQEGLIGFENSSIDTAKTLWMGEVDQPYMDEAFIASLFSGIGSAVSVKVIRDKNSGLPGGYCFITFASHEVADRVLHAYNGLQVANTHKRFNLNWARYVKLKQQGAVLPGNFEQYVRKVANGQVVEITAAKKDPLMRKLDVVELNLEYAAFHCEQNTELLRNEFLFL
jgi:RNA recognition motif-containing protein